MQVTLAKCELPDVSALMKLKTKKGLDSDWAQTLTNTLDRWFLPKVPLEDSSLSAFKLQGGNLI